MIDLDKIAKDIEEKSIDNYIDNYINNLENKRKLVSSKEYLDWLENFSKKGPFNDEDISYNDEIDVIDKENGKIISYFASYIYSEAQIQSVFEEKQEGEFDEERFIFMYNDNFYEIWTIFGQGSITGINKIEKPDNDNYVILGRDLTEEEKKDKELIEYIIVNTDLDMSPGKIAAQVGHVCGMCAEEQGGSAKYNAWKMFHDYKKIILSGHTKTLEKLEEQGFFAVRDKGYTEIPENSLTAVSLGIMKRKDAKPFIKRLQLLK